MARPKRNARKPTVPKEATPSRGAGFSFSARWAAALLGLLVIIFFHQLVFGGKTFVSPDAEGPVGFVRVGEQSLYRDRVYPLWNPYVFLGMPSFASGAYNPLIYPPDWPLALVQKVLPLPELTWMLLYYFLGGWFLYLLARDWGARREGALIGGAFFIFVPNLVAVGSHGHGSQLVNSAYLPLMLWLSARWIRTGRLAVLAALALAGGFQMLRGHVQICYYTWLAIALYLLVEAVAVARRGALSAWLPRAAAIAGAMALAFGLAAFYNLPLRDYARHSIRGGGPDGGVGMDYATGWSLAPFELPSVVLPGWVGFGGETYWGAMPFTDYPNAYVGIVAAVFLLPAFLANGAPRVFALAMAALALMISFGKHFPLYGLLYDHLPLFNKFRIPVMVILLFHTATALGAAWGWSRVIEEAEQKPARAGPVVRLTLAAAVVIALVFAIGVLGQEMWRESYVRHVTASLGARSAELLQQSGIHVVSDLAAKTHREFVAGIGRACLLGLLAAGVVLAAVRRWAPPPVTSLAALALLLVDLWAIGGRLMTPAIGPKVDRPLDAGRDDVVEFLEKAGPPGSFRIFPLIEFRSNKYAGFAIASAGGYHAAKPRRVQDLIERQMIVNFMWSRLLNIRYWVSDGHIQNGPSYFREVYNGSQVVYENLAALPRATLVGKYRVVTPDSAIVDTIGSGAVDPAEVAFFDHDPGLTLGSVEGAQARIVSYRLNDVTVETESPGPALLRLADTWHPDWEATVDGKPVEILRADYLLRAVPVPAGKHRVEFHFRPRSMRQGLLVSLASLVVILGLFAVDFVRRRRARPPAAPAGETA
ncbi:MAG TPA: YfhO family protein [Candidatus Limnocylindria bacterium]|nr:YfhO family protein [Candidatus Limnocylindria bacterium]